MNLYPLKTDVQKADIYQLSNGNEFALLDIEKGKVLNGFLADNTLTELLEVYMYDMAGEPIYNRFGNTLPISINLIKTEETTELLMDATPAEDEQSVRIWHILDAKGGAVNIGCKNKTKLALHSYSATTSDTFLLKSNQAFQIEAGITLLEIAYLPSELSKALPVSDLTDTQFELLEVSPKTNALLKVKDEVNTPKNIYQTEKLTSNIITIEGAIVRDYYPLDSFVIITCTEGQLILDGDFDDKLPLQKGECAFIPADIKELKFKAASANCSVIETYISSNK